MTEKINQGYKYLSDITINNQSLSIFCKKSKRKTIVFHLDKDNDIAVKAPLRYSDRSIFDFVNKNNEWIRKVLLKKQSYKLYDYIEDVKAKKKYFYLGELYHIFFHISKENKVVVDSDKKTINVFHKDGRSDKTLNEWKRKEAEKLFNNRLDVLFITFLNFYHCKKPLLKLRSMTSRWGSLSSKGMNLNINLIHSSISCIDMVIVHELCHLKHKNHKQNFYDLHDKITSNRKAKERELKEYSLIIVHH